MITLFDIILIVWNSCFINVFTCYFYFYFLCFRWQFLVLLFVVALFGHLNKGLSAQAQNGGNQDNTCLHDNQLYPPGSIINMGRSDNWCYGSYCAKAKQVKHWDDYNCPMPSRDNPSPQIPAHVQLEIQQLLNPQQSTGQQQQQEQQSLAAAVQQQTVFGTPMFGSKPLFPPEQINNAQLSPPTTESSMVGRLFGIQGCWYRDRFFWPGSDIFNGRNGNKCRGAYCDWNARVQHWEDSCTVTVPPPPRRIIDRT